MPWKTDANGRQYCPHCGAENKRKNATTCDECYRSPDEKPQQQQPAPKGTPSIELLQRAIEEATKPSGERPYKKCPKCGAGANKGEVACRNCGATLGHTIEEVIDASQGTIGVATLPPVQKHETIRKTTLGNLTAGQPSERSHAMQQWEYYTAKWGGMYKADLDEISEFLDGIGVNGWELVSISVFPNVTGSGHGGGGEGNTAISMGMSIETNFYAIMIFKRPKRPS